MFLGLVKTLSRSRRAVELGTGRASVAVPDPLVASQGSGRVVWGVLHPALTEVHGRDCASIVTTESSYLCALESPHRDEVTLSSRDILRSLK